jgi:hypothetical protein
MIHARICRPRRLGTVSHCERFEWPSARGAWHLKECAVPGRGHWRSARDCAARCLQGKIPLAGLLIALIVIVVIPSSYHLCPLSTPLPFPALPRLAPFGSKLTSDGPW